MLKLCAQSGLGVYKFFPRPRPSGAAAAPQRAPAEPLDAAFADVPLWVSARIVDMALPLSAVAQLQPGQILPVAIARAVPLSIGGVVIGFGSVGAVDDRVGMQLSQIF